MTIKPIIITILFLTSGIFYYNITDAKSNLQTFQISQIVDGDTVRLTNGATLRLIGINTPERNMPYFQEAKSFLTTLIQNKSVQVQSFGIGKYGRTLAFIFLNDKNINTQILSAGLATLYCYENDPCLDELKQAEEFARLNQKALWKKSPDENCIKLIQLKTDEPEKLILQNKCDKQINITFKDDATHIYRETLNPKSTFTKKFSHIWNTNGDSLYISDDKGLLLFHRYQASTEYP
ncbi:thermonuclease family protein [archaeon]|jgi:endonuclease YncB( thermonuclease family)|nr:thermonuclease family protein [archaeon]